MRNKRAGNPFQALLKQVAVPRSAMVGVILVVALIAFEMFNFDTTQYALRSLLGDIRFLGLGWATILAVAFCAIDFAGLARLFTPERGSDEPKEVWYLMGAWLLGASMNAVMTWWAVSLTLLNHPFGNEVLSREELLRSVPVFVAILVWLTRILFIGSLTVTGEKLLYGEDYEPRSFGRRASSSRPATANNRVATNNVSSARPRRAVPKPQSRPAPVTGAPAEEYVPYYASSASSPRSMGEPATSAARMASASAPAADNNSNEPSRPTNNGYRPASPIRPTASALRQRAPRAGYMSGNNRSYYSSPQKPKTVGKNLD
ncbi:MAG: hypothetical protein H6651_08845 [Ardenticatenales bacterium]|nr:hypothetical protein [Ardenticatenales bacterium]